MPGRIGAEDVAIATVAGTIDGAVQALGPRRTYEILQPLIDAITDAAIAEENQRGQPK
jgi:hypothetical protein